MMQFYDTYRGLSKLAPLVRVLSWTHNLLIMSRSKRDEEREFYLRLCVKERWRKRQLERQLAGALFERVALSPAKLSPPVRELHPEAASVFKDSYLVEFLDLPKQFEADLHDGLVAKLKDFLIELGRDFLLCRKSLSRAGWRPRFSRNIDLLFFHRGLNCLIDIELKVDELANSRQAGVLSGGARPERRRSP